MPKHTSGQRLPFKRPLDIGRQSSNCGVALSLPKISHFLLCFNEDSKLGMDTSTHLLLDIFTLVFAYPLAMFATTTTGNLARLLQLSRADSDNIRSEQVLS